MNGKTRRRDGGGTKEQTFHVKLQVVANAQKKSGEEKWYEEDGAGGLFRTCKDEKKKREGSVFLLQTQKQEWFGASCSEPAGTKNEGDEGARGKHENTTQQRKEGMFQTYRNEGEIRLCSFCKHKNEDKVGVNTKTGMESVTTQQTRKWGNDDQSVNTKTM